MNITPKTVKRTLKKTVKEISSNPQSFAKNPEKDFIRRRKLPADKMMYSVLSMSSKDLKCELMDFFDMNKNMRCDLSRVFFAKANFFDLKFLT